jgi:hypothetical protein
MLTLFLVATTIGVFLFDYSATVDLTCSDVPSYVMMWNWNPMGQDHETPK